MSAKVGGWKRNKAISTCRYMISFAVYSMGAADGACVGDGLVGEGGSAMRLSMKERKLDRRQMSDDRSKSTWLT